MSSAVTSFSSRIRDAGDLERDSKLYGSFRSINKFDLEESKKRTDQQQQQQQQRRMSKHEDIFLEALIQPVREQRAAKEVIAPLPPSSKSSASKDGQRKRTRKHHNHDKTSRDSSKQRPPRSDNESTEANNPTGSNDNDVDEFMESLRRRTSRNRRRRQNKENQEPIAADDDNEAPFGGSESKRPGLNSSFSGPINNDSSQINNGSRNRRNSLVVKRAFEEPEKRTSGGADESVLGNGAGNEIEVGVDQKKPTPRSTTASGSTPSTSRRGSVQQPATTTMTSDSRVIGYFSPLLKSNTLDFVLSPAPQMSNTIVNCKITCQKGIFTEYSFWLDGIVNQGRDLLVMKAHRRVTSTKSYYLITLINYDNLGLRLEEQSACARVVSNIYRNKFKLELSNSSLSSPSSSPSSVVAINSSTSSSLATSSSNRELLSVSYKSTMGEPTKISANACLCGKENSEETGRVTYFLKNRAPVFDMYRRKYVLEYNGRAKKSSKHNFQVVDESRDTDEVLIQLGKLETGVYSCDYAFPLCALQAFGFALSSLCR